MSMMTIIMDGSWQTLKLMKGLKERHPPHDMIAQSEDAILSPIADFKQMILLLNLSMTALISKHPT
jgi:hypothetical protein